MINEFKTYLTCIKGYSENTAVAYAKDLRTFARYMRQQDSAKRWSTVTREDVDAYIIHLSNTGHKPATLCRHLSSISSLYRYIQREGHDISNPAKYESRPKIGKSSPNTIPIDHLFNAMAKAKGLVKMMIQILAETGIRIQECLDIRQEDIDFLNGTIRIKGKGNKERLVYISKETLTWLSNQNSLGNKTIFGDITQREARREIWEALKDYTNAPQKSPHAIRHTYATEMAKRGMTATTLQKALGHEHLETTQKYIDFAQVETERECRQLSLFN